MAHPCTWLHQRRWEGFIEDATDQAARLQRAAALDGDHALIAKEFGLPVYEKWFADVLVDRGPPFRIIFFAEFKRNWAQSNFAGRLRRIFLIDSIALELRQAEGKAA